MTLTGIQKAALLLTALDQPTASELLKGQSREVIQKVAMELSRWDGKQKKNVEKLSMVAHEFCSGLTKTHSGELNIKSFIGALIPESDAGKGLPLKHTLQQAAIKSDPYLIISDASAVHLAAALEKEPPQAIAIVLSNVDPKLCSDVLERLPEEKAQLTVWRMTQDRETPSKTIRRIGEIVSQRLIDMQSAQNAPAGPDATHETLRRVALVLNGLPADKRQTWLKQIQDRDSATADTIRSLMVTWEDILKIEDKSLQQILRKIEASLLARAMHGADASIVEKIKQNISERMMAMIAEETSLMGDMRKKDVLEARQEVAQPLREAFDSGDLLFIEQEGTEHA